MCGQLLVAFLDKNLKDGMMEKEFEEAYKRLWGQDSNPIGFLLPLFLMDSYAKVGNPITFNDGMPNLTPNVLNGIGTHKVVG